MWILGLIHGLCVSALRVFHGKCVRRLIYFQQDLRLSVRCACNVPQEPGIEDRVRILEGGVPYRQMHYSLGCSPLY